MLKLEFIHLYLKYLNKWNKSASLTSILNSIDNYGYGSTHDELSELYSVAVFEYDDTQRDTKDKILSMMDIYSQILVANRDSKIDEILKDA